MDDVRQAAWNTDSALLSTESASAFLAEGVALKAAGRLGDAIASFRRAVSLEPGNYTALRQLAHTLLRSGDPGASIECYREIELIHSLDGADLTNFGLAYRRAGRVEEGVACFRRAIEILPNCAEAWNNLSDALSTLGQFAEAAECAHQALLLRPDYVEAHHNLANALRGIGEPTAAHASYRRALELRPGFLEAWNGLGNLLREQGDLSGADACIRQALALRPTDPATRMNHALLRLTRGEFREGWADYQARWSIPRTSPRTYPEPRWSGESISGKAVLVFGEQGIGDEIMFASCIPDLVAATTKCWLECDVRLAPLFARSFPEVAVVPRTSRTQLDWSADFPEAEAKIAAGDLPRLFRTDVSCFPNRNGYLIVDSLRQKAWRERLAALGAKAKVGISWRGGKCPYASRLKSAPLEHWRNVLRTPHVQFVNLQYGECGAELEEITRRTGIEIHAFPEVDPLRDIDDFAALISALDLVISIDNSTVHLAGALGIPVWAALNAAADWRWLRERDTSPWYPSARLFRQRSQGDWTSAFDAIAAALSHQLDNNHACAE